MKTREKIIAIACLPKLTLEQRLVLVSSLLTVDEILRLTRMQLCEIMGHPIFATWSATYALKTFPSFFSWYQKEGNEIVFYGDSHYPPLLRTIADPPFLLTYRGNLSHPGLALSIVGTRNATLQALQAAYALGLECGAAQVLVVSGFARGIDLAAHGGACAIGAPSWAILGSGLSYLSKMSKYRTQRMLDCQGAFISEFHPQAQPLPWRFPIRNRLIAALAPVTVVIQAPCKSGALITADYALRQGREVVVHHQGTSSSGSAALIEDGAPVVHWLGDVASETHIKYSPMRRAIPTHSGGTFEFDSQQYTLMPLGTL
ncbi:MAG: DNA-protecting protein DprA [Sphaerochaetaceae bacterium]|jgi:DNA processing protein|nr:DNA-protecting protein DprA [Sphaerochaetaceae bacterium]